MSRVGTTAQRERASVNPFGGRWRRSLSLSLLLLPACGPRQPTVLGPVPDAAAAAAVLGDRTALSEAVQIVFDWRANDRGVRSSGRGVARAAPPAHARLDLFLANGETVLRAALVDDDLRMPTGTPDDILPPPDLLWGSLGVLRPGERTRFLAGERLEGDATRLRYGFGDGTELHYRIEGGKVTRVERVERGYVVEDVVMTYAADDRFPMGAIYRHRADFRELELTRTDMERVPGFSEDIWNPGHEEQR